MSCIPATHSMNANFNQVDSQNEDSPVERRGSRAYQIFPEVNIDEESDSITDSKDFLYRRERLPSIVVEPTEHSELQSGEMSCPPQYQMSNSVEEEEHSSVDSTEGSVDREQQEDVGTEGCTVARKSSIGPSQSQLSISRLTPPSSPTPPETAPPCLKS